MRWFKCLSPNSPLVLSTIKEVGKHGAFECFCVVAEAINQDVVFLDVEAVKNWAAVKRDRAEKLLRFSQEILLETLKINGKSIENPYKNPEKSDENLSEISQKTDRNLSQNDEKSNENLLDFDPSNPGGRNNSNSINTINSLEKEEREKALSQDEKFIDAVNQGYRFLAKSEDPNFLNLNWVVGFLTTQFERVLANRPDMKLEHVLECWMDTCCKAQNKGINQPGWFKTVFEDKVNTFKPGINPVRNSAKSEKLRHEIILAAEKLIYRLDGRRFKGSDLDYKPPEKLGYAPVFVIKESGEELDFNHVVLEGVEPLRKAV